MSLDGGGTLLRRRLRCCGDAAQQEGEKTFTRTKPTDALELVL